jgi:hypothetical protein
MVMKNLALTQVVEAEEARKAQLLSEMHLPPKPLYSVDGEVVDGPPKVPLRLSELSDDELMRLMAALTRWTDYFAGLVAIADVEERSANLIYEKAKALALLRAWSGGKDDRTTIAKAEVSADPTILEYEAAYENAHARKRFTAVHFEAAERDAAVVSRELTRRVGKKESHERRVERWTP